MRILIDFIPFQHNGGVGGAASFAKAVYDQLFTQCDRNIQVYGAYDATVPAGRQYDYRQYAAQHHVSLLDISAERLATLTEREHIDTFFIAIGQFYAPYDMSGIQCKTIMFIHDLFDLERLDNRIDLLLPDTRWAWLKRLINLSSGRWARQARQKYEAIMPLYAAPNTLAYTVSEYSRNALHYYFPEIRKDIRVCYSPLRQADALQPIQDDSLRRLVDGRAKYLLLLAANRRYKNASLLLKVYQHLLVDHPDLHLLTLKYGRSIHPQHIDIPFLSDSDLEHAYQHAHALVFGSYFEGFGYPPIEAMRYDTPTVASNVTSIPEIVGDAGIYFSPFYPADLYRALKQVLQDRDRCQQAISRRLQEIQSRQEADLQALVSELLKP